jgi:2-phosphosulfolactate phosphatase
MPSETYSQAPHRIRLARGHQGAKETAIGKHILVVIDTLSFSTAAITAVHHGGIVFPCAKDEDPIAFAKSIHAEAAVGRLDVPTKGRFSLSPRTYLNLEPETRLVLASPNGATCSRYARDVPYLFIGTLINAKAVAKALAHLLKTTHHTITLLSCGERWIAPNADGELRWALEDDLGAGAILSYLEGDKSPEAMAVEGMFLHLKDQLTPTLVNCASGRELVAKGFETDVTHAAQLNRYESVPYMQNDYLTHSK